MEELHIVKERKISIVKNHKLSGVETSLDSIYRKIKGGAYKEQVLHIRSLIESKKFEDANRLKNMLTAFTASGIFRNGRTMKDLAYYSQLLILDIDKLSVDAVFELKTKIAALPYTLMCFISPSGLGLKIIVRVNSSKDHHKEVYKQVLNYYSKEIEIKFDEKTNDITRLCYLSYDPETYYNPQAEMFIMLKDLSISNNSSLQQDTSESNQDTLSDTAFKRALEYTQNLNDFAKGNRNNFIFRLACNCNRFALDIKFTEKAITTHFSGEFNEREIKQIVQSVYSRYKDSFGKQLTQIVTTPKFSSNESIDETEQEIVELPVIPDFVIDNLPGFIKHIALRRESARERDVIVITTLMLLSGSLYKTMGIYDDSTIYPNLFSFIVAPAGSGKGVIKIARKLFERLNKDIEKECLQEIAKYYDENPDKKDLDDDKNLPPYIQLFIPGNSSAAALYNQLQKNKGVGIICESEADALGTILKNEWGNFSHILRAAFHQETVSISRSGGDKKLIINNPKLAVALAGTPSQVSSIIPSVEDGLFSRFIFYYFSNRTWRNTFKNKEKEPLNNLIRYASFEISQAVRWLNLHPTMVTLSEEHSTHLIEHFGKKYMELSSFYSEEIDSTIKRMPLVVFKICMILTAIRKEDNIVYDYKVDCSDTDFKIALELGNIFLEHALFMFMSLPQKAKTTIKNAQMHKFYKLLPNNNVFSRADAIEVAAKHHLGISDKTVYNYLDKLIGKDENGLIEKLGHSKYKKRA